VAEAVLPAPRARVGVRAILIGVAVLAVALATTYWAVALRGYESTDDAFVDGHMVFLSPRVAGQVIEVHVEENQHVRAGDVLVRLDPAEYMARFERARADVDTARNRMAQSQASADAAAAQSAALLAKLRHAEQELARAQQLFEGGVASRTALDGAVAVRDAAAGELHASEERERSERAVVGNEAPVRMAEAALREAELNLEHTTVSAPFDGVVGKKNAELGANVAPNQPLVALTEDTASWVSANFKETQIAEMNPGDPAEIFVDAFPNAKVRGHVESLSPATGAKYALLPPDNATGNFTKVVQRVPVRIAIDAIEGDTAGLVAGGDGKPWLPVGLSVNVRVHVR